MKKRERDDIPRTAATPEATPSSSFLRGDGRDPQKHLAGCRSALDINNAGLIPDVH